MEDDLLTQLIEQRMFKELGKVFIDKPMQLNKTCWVCDRPFTNNLLFEDHHVIPRAFGGTNGPQVRLCSDHHSLLHKIADRLVPQKQADLQHIQPFLLGLTTKAAKAIIYLACTAAIAERTFSNDPNRGVPVSFSIPNSLLIQAKKATKTLNLTMPDLLMEALQEYLRRRFPL
jgi:hypothetical protein